MQSYLDKIFNDHFVPCIGEGRYIRFVAERKEVFMLNNPVMFCQFAVLIL